MLNQAVISFHPDRQTAEKLNLETNFMLDAVYYSNWCRGITSDVDLIWWKPGITDGLSVQKDEDENIDNAKEMLFCIFLEYFRMIVHQDITSPVHQRPNHFNLIKCRVTCRIISMNLGKFNSGWLIPGDSDVGDKVMLVTLGYNDVCETFCWRNILVKFLRNCS